MGNILRGRSFLSQLRAVGGQKSGGDVHVSAECVVREQSEHDTQAVVHEISEVPFTHLKCLDIIIAFVFE